MINCGRCHDCGRPVRIVLDGEEWCDNCQKYQRPISHGWSYYAGGEDTPCWVIRELANDQEGL